MGETLTNINIENLVVGKIFDEDELIVELSKTAMSTVRQTLKGDGEIIVYYYDFPGNNQVHHNGHLEYYSDDRGYDFLKKKLVEAKLWR